MVRVVLIALLSMPMLSCTEDPEGDDEGSMGTEGDGSADDSADGADGEGGDAADGAEGGSIASCDDVEMAPLDDDPDQGFIDVTEFCVEEINRYRAMEGLEPYTIKEDGKCCSALEARQAWLDDTHHNGDYCDWQSQGAAGGGRNPNGDARKSMEWVPRLFYQEKGDTFEESGGHYQGMMRPEPRPVACGWYGHDRDNHRVVVNYW